MGENILYRTLPILKKHMKDIFFALGPQRNKSYVFRLRKELHA